MDPNAALHNLMQAVTNHDKAAYEDALRHLTNWQVNKGFMPDKLPQAGLIEPIGSGRLRFGLWRDALWKIAEIVVSHEGPVMLPEIRLIAEELTKIDVLVPTYSLVVKPRKDQPL